MSSDVEKIKERLDAVDVIGSYINLQKAGSQYKAKCPFHNEKTPSFMVSPDRGTYYCFGCGAKGDIFTFVQEFEGLDFRGALKLLADRAGVELEDYDPKEKDKKDRLYEALEVATLFFQKKLGDRKDVRDYLKKRGVVLETAKTWKLGFAPSEWRSLFEYLDQKGFTEKEMLSAGLIKKTSDGRKYDTFRGRIIFPIFDTSGRVIAFSGRIFEDDGKSPKYLNSPDSDLFNKSEVLYGLNNAKDQIRTGEMAILVEGQMDLILCHQSGFDMTVATSGTSVTHSHLLRLKKLTPKLILAFDGDHAGISAATKSSLMALPLGLEVLMIDMPENKDPADMVIEDLETWRKLVDKAPHIIIFLANFLAKKVKDKRILGKEVSKLILPLIKQVPSAVEQKHFISQLAPLLDVSPDDISKDLEKVSVKKPSLDGEEKSYVSADKLFRLTPEEIIAALIFWKEEKSKKGEVEETIKKILEYVSEEYLNSVIENQKSKKEELLFNIERLFGEKGVKEKQVDDIIKRFQDDYLKNQLKRLKLSIQEVENRGEDAEDLLQNYTKVLQKRNKLLESNI